MNDKRLYSNTGINTLKARLNSPRSSTKVQLPVMNRIDRRSPAARELMCWQAGLVSDLGGDDQITVAQRTIIELATRTKLLVDYLDGWLIQQRTLVNYKKKQVLPVLMQRQQLADALARYMQTLGLERRAKPVPDLSSYLASVSANDNDHGSGKNKAPGALLGDKKQAAGAPDAGNSTTEGQ